VSNIWDRERLLRSTVLAGFAASGLAFAPAVAQDAVQTPSQEDCQPGEVLVDGVCELDSTEERIVVTGSRIARDEFSSASPIQVIDGEIARDLGFVDASDLLGQTTVVQGQQTTTGLSTSAGQLTDSGPGSASASLRGLDSGRTLVLVNGRRLAPAGVRGAPSAPDLNLIPGTLVERVEVLLDGASSVYGSDAVAGVVNYILRDDFDGIELDAFYTDPEMAGNGGQQQVYSATMGVSNNRGSMAFAVEYSKTEGFTDREFGSFWEPYAGECNSFYWYGASGDVYESCSGSFGVGSTNFSGYGYGHFDPGANVAGWPAGWSPIPITADLLTPGSVNGRNLLFWPEELDQTYSPDFERVTLYTIGEYDLDLYTAPTLYFEASHSRRNTTNSSIGQGRVRVPGSYIFNPFGTDGTLYYATRAENATEVSQTRLIGGLRGDLPFLEAGTLSNWSYDMYASYSRSNGYDRVRGYYDMPRFHQTLNNSYIDGNGDAQCSSYTVPGETQQVECRPLNFFDGTFINTGRFADEADNEYFFPNRITNTVVEQSVITGFITGDLFELPAGPVSMVLGGEYRKDTITTETDAGAASGDFFGFFADPGSNGTRDLQEAFFEVEAPLLEDAPLVHELSVNLAGRYTDESNFGSESTYRVQALYAPTDWLRFRGTFGTSFRAPNLGEQFGGRVQGFGNPNDPCRVPGLAVPLVDHDNDPTTDPRRFYDPTLDTRDPTVLQNCINGGGPYNFPGVDITSLGTQGLGTPTTVFLGAPTQVATGSNPNLDAETSEAVSAGFVFEQPWTDAFDLRFSATYFEIKVDGEVASLSATDIVALCYNSPGLTDTQCQYIQRDTSPGSTGEILFVEALNQNLGQRISEGVDYNVEFGREFNVPFLNREVRYDAIFRATQMMTQTEEEIGANGTTIDDDLGEYGSPEWRMNLTNIVSYRDWSFLWQTRYVGEMIEDNADEFDETTSSLNPCVQAGDGPCYALENSPEYWVHDMSVTWRSDDLAIRGGIRNVFDEAPFVQSNTGSVRGVGYDLGGRTLFVNVTKAF